MKQALKRMCAVNHARRGKSAGIPAAFLIGLTRRLISIKGSPSGLTKTFSALSGGDSLILAAPVHSRGFSD